MKNTALQIYQIGDNNVVHFKFEKVGFQTGIKLGYGPKTVKLGMSAGDVSQWLVYLFDYRDEESGQLAYENGLLNIEVVDEKTGEFLFTKK